MIVSKNVPNFVNKSVRYSLFYTDKPVGVLPTPLQVCQCKIPCC